MRAALQRLLVSSSIYLHSLRPTAANAPENGCAMTEAASARTPLVSPNVTKPHSQSGEREEEEEEGEGPIFCFLPGSKDDGGGDVGGGDKIAEAKRGKGRERSGNSPLHIRFPSLGSPQPRQTHFSNSAPFLGVVGTSASVLNKAFALDGSGVLMTIL